MSATARRRRRLLLTGFPPFVGRPTNPTLQLVEAIRSGQVNWPESLDVIAEVLPCEYESIEPRFMELVEQWQPEIVLAFGVGHSGPLLHLEQIGFNWDDSHVPDNAGVIRQCVPIVATGPESITASLDVNAIYCSLAEAGFDAILSESAGRFLCNHLLYFGLHYAQSIDSPYRMAFIHVRPLEHEQEFAMLLRAVEHVLNGLAD